MIRAKDFKQLYLALRSGRKVEKAMLYYALEHPAAYAEFVAAYRAKERQGVADFIKNVLSREVDNACLPA